jgi:imidazolonepropionase-like amidohydrolase
MNARKPSQSEVRTALLIIVALVAGGCSRQPDQPAADLLIRGGRLLDMVDDQPTLKPLKGIVVSSDKVQRIVAADSADELPGAATVVEAGDGIVMPGLIDSHIHFRAWVPEPALHYGVTTVFDTGPCGADCGDDPNGFIIGHAKAVNAPGAPGPTMYYTATKLDGPNGIEAIEIYRLQSLDEVAPKIDWLVGLGASGIKVEENLPPDYLRRITDEAGLRGLPVVGHTKDAREAIAAGIKFIEHMDPISHVVAKDPARVKDIADPSDQMDFAKVPDLIRLMVDNGVYLNPTLVGRYGAISPRAQEFHDEDERLLQTDLFAKVPQAHRERYLEGSLSARNLSPDEKARRLKGYENVQRFVREFSEQGGLLLAATDMGNSRMPGIALYREMQLIVDAGVPPYKALLGGTRYAAEMMKKSNLIGTVEAGKQADLLILGSNPAEDIAAVKDIRHVIRKGKVVRGQ